MLLFRVFHSTYTGITDSTTTLTAVTAGKANHKGAFTTSTTTLGASTIAHKVAHGQSGAFLTLNIISSGFLGRVKAKGATTATETLSAATVGTRKRYGASDFTGTLTAGTNGQVSGVRLYSIRLTATNASGSDSETKTDYVTVRTHHFGATDFAGTLVATTTPKGPDVHHWSVRLTATNSGGSNTKTRTDYITTLQPKPGFDFTGLFSSQTLGYAKHRGAATSFTGTLSALTKTTKRGATAFTGTLSASTVPKVKAKASAGWGTLWGESWGGVSALGSTTTLAASTVGTGGGAVLGATSFTGLLTAGTVAKVGAKNNATTATITLTAGTAGSRIRYSSTAFTGVLNASTISSTSTTNQTSFIGTLAASTVPKVKEKGAFTFTATLDVTTDRSHGLPDLTEFTDSTIGLSDLTDTTRNLTETTDSTRTLTGVAG